ncbi:hypothetical protein EDC14_102080 [Hydrogenispora ethanolica]|uniref:PAS domain-containing protein n=1 Tax=Hydrogenispora ethanolica TaxID=1082276 RepID=A0A4R1RD49_HYDET|nr:PAS domain-containing protein [Hydrogenispora ethanolica]TCL63795.1 hypothetical protein EDC14_102080 [Hydrogenispora ethanolica]
MIDGMDEQILRAMYETLPVEISIIDANDEIIGWNKHETRLFKRPLTAMNIDFRYYQPDEALPKAELIIREMKEGKYSKAHFWFDLKPDHHGKMQKVLIEFYALRDYSGKYLGCMECTHNVSAESGEDLLKGA